MPAWEQTAEQDFVRHFAPFVITANYFFYYINKLLILLEFLWEQSSSHWH